jgi:cyclomaltodextrinase / maltogenic alpha-amylase / neopullulanase
MSTIDTSNPPIKTPEWVKMAVFYQIFPDRFARSGRVRPPLAHPMLEPWDAEPTFHGFKGGDLFGVIDRLPHLQDLGITAIYFTPVFQSAACHRYHTHDYYQVDPLLGGNGAFRELLQEAHRRGIRIVLDGVFNHASRGFFFFHDVLENGAKSPWLDWWHVRKLPLSAYGEIAQDPGYACWWDFPALPEFNHANPDVREYIMQVGEHWIREGIDGWRLDVPACVKVPGFWQEFRQRVKRLNPEAYICGEIWTDARPWLDGAQFDAVMNYLFTDAVLRFVGGSSINKSFLHYHFKPFAPADAGEYGARIEHLLGLYPWEIQLAQMNLLGSHDTARFLSVVQGDRSALELAALLLFTFPGAPCIYYGDEVGMTGGPDPQCRRGYPSQNDWDLNLYEHFRSLIQLRRQHPALARGQYKTRLTKGKLYIFERHLGEERVLVAVNTGTTTASASLAEEGTREEPWHLVFGHGQIAQQDGALQISVPGRTGLVLCAQGSAMRAA